nr:MULTISPECIES: serine hydrolase domain-containing protein [Myxococcaceae]
MPDAGAPDAGDPDAGSAGRFDAVDALVAAAVADAGVPGATLAVYDAQDHRVFVKSYGDFAPDRRVAVASASKLVSAVVLLRLVDAGVLSLDSTTGSVLGWTGPEGAVTLRQLLSFTSGLQAAPNCTLNPATTLRACADAIGAAGLTGTPGAQFEYGSGHLQVAAAMAETVTRKRWAQLFEEQLKVPLGLTSAELAYFTFPRQASGTLNPLVAGGLRATVDEYARLLSVVFHKGQLPTGPLADPALFDTQAREPYPDARIVASPMQDHGLPYRYGLGNWLECGTPATGCPVVSSPGAFGFDPWVDRVGNYYAILGMQLETDDNEGVGSFSVFLEEQLRPLLREALQPAP